jgi:hypothetical protein
LLLFFVVVAAVSAVSASPDAGLAIFCSVCKAHNEMWLLHHLTQKKPSKNRFQKLGTIERLGTWPPTYIHKLEFFNIKICKSLGRVLI